MTKFYIFPECYVDTTVVSRLLDSKVNHQFGCFQVSSKMEMTCKDQFAIGIIDHDKVTPKYLEQFDEWGKSRNITLMRHRQRCHYLIVIDKAMETFLLDCAKEANLSMKDYNLPEGIAELTKFTKNKLKTQNDPNIIKLINDLKAKSPEMKLLKALLVYLDKEMYNATEKGIKSLFTVG